MPEELHLYNCWEKDHIYFLGEQKHNEIQSKNMQTYYLPGWLNGYNQMKASNRALYSDFRRTTLHCILVQQYWQIYEVVADSRLFIP